MTIKYKELFEDFYNVTIKKHGDNFNKYYPRKIVPPGNNYFNVKYYSAVVCSNILYTDTNHIADTYKRNHFNKLVDFKIPTYFLESNFLLNFWNTDLTNDLQLKDIKFFANAALIVLPLDTSIEIFGIPFPFISFTKVNNVITYNYPFFDGKNISNVYSFIVIDETKTLKDLQELELKPLDFENIEFNPEKEKEFKTLTENFLIKLFLAVTSIPASLKHGDCIRKAKHNARECKSFNELWSANVIGDNFKNSNLGTLEDRKSPRMHFRRGHYRRQHYGLGNSLTKVIWILPVLVKKENYVVNSVAPFSS